MGVKNYMKGSNTMNLKPIDFSEPVINPQDLIDRQALVLTEWRFCHTCFQCMTISWGLIGFYGTNLAMVAVRPTRYTYTLWKAHQTLRYALSHLLTLAMSLISAVTLAGMRTKLPRPTLLRLLLHKSTRPVMPRQSWSSSAARYIGPT